MLRIKALASGSTGNAFIVESSHARFLIEAGLPAPRLLRLLESEGVDPSKLAVALVSHEHHDHVQAAEELALGYGVSVMADEQVLKVAGLASLPQAHALPVGRPFRVSDVEVSCFPVPHDSISQVGFCLRCDGKTVCIATDVGDDCALLAEHIGGADLVVLEANHYVHMLLTGQYPNGLKRRIMSSTGHLSNAQAAGILARNVRRPGVDVWLAHLSRHNNSPAVARREISRTLKEAVGYPVRLDVVARTRPSLEWPRAQQLALFDI